MREDYVHFFVREFLKAEGWRLLAGQYPNGSDDELPILNIVDPNLARDQSPDPRRHSQNKLVPDLIALKHNKVIVVELKPRFDRGDEVKLLHILHDRRVDFLHAFAALLRRAGVQLPWPLRELLFIPILGFASPKQYPRRHGFAYLLVKGPEVILDSNGIEL